jgi:hypothetical protein
MPNASQISTFKTHSFLIKHFGSRIFGGSRERGRKTERSEMMRAKTERVNELQSVLVTP